MAIEIFCCYAHEDEVLLNKLKSHLRPLQRQGLIGVWHDSDISAGMEWEQVIGKHLNEADIILLLISPDFMGSDYCYSIEMKRALERHECREAYVIPVILRHVYWQGEPLGKLQALPTDAKPVISSSWHDLDEAFFDVTEGIRKVVDEFSRLGKMENSLGSLKSSEKPSYFEKATVISSQSRDAREVPKQLDSEQVASPHRLRVFLCHDPEDKLAVRNLYQCLKARDVDSWFIEENLLAGQQWEHEIRKAVRATDVVIVCLSRRSINQTGFIQKEIKFALDVANEQSVSTIFLILLKLEECELPERLKHLHWVNYFQEGDFDRLMSVLERRAMLIGIQLAPTRYHASIQPEPTQSSYQPHSQSAITDPPKKFQMFNRSNSRRAVLAGLIGLAIVGVAGGSIAWLEALHGRVSSGSASTPKPTPSLPRSLLFTYRGHTDTVNAVAWSPDGTYIASAGGGSDSTVQVWDAADGGHVYTYYGHQYYGGVNAVAWSPNGRRIASAGGSYDDTVQVWDAADGGHVYTYRGHTNFVSAVAWSPDGRRIASASTDRTVQVWDAADGGHVYTYRGHTDTVIAVAWSPNGKRIASGSFDTTVQVWQAV
jgi:hypothetical protein